MWDSASRLFSQVSICEPSTATICPSPHIPATSRVVNALITSAEHRCTLSAVECLLPAV
jgi:hypothetical protein